MHLDKREGDDGMPIKRVIVIGLILFLIGLGLNIAETWYFGWNMRPESTAETYADIVTAIPFGFGLIMMTRALLTFKINR